MVSYENYKQFYDNENNSQQMHFAPILSTRPFIAQYLVEKKANNSNYTVIDIGAGADFWTRDFADATIDYYYNENVSSKHFKANIERESGWKEVLDYVEENGKFDFCICSHTLEDLYYPFVAFENIPKIAKQGLISVPSMHREMGKGDRGQPSKGFDHHRFVYHPSEDNRVILIPKMGHMEYKKYNVDTTGMKNELQIWWSEKIDYIDVYQYFEMEKGSPKIAGLEMTKKVGNNSSIIFEAYARLDPNQPVTY